MKFRDRIARFMAGRYGVDDLSKVMMWVILALLVVTIFVPNLILELAVIALLVYNYYRVLSRNQAKRYAENQKYLSLLNRVKQSKQYHFYRCPNPQCKATIRIPRGKGKIQITCPKCKTQFIKKS